MNKTAKSENKWLEWWNAPWHTKDRIERFETLDRYLTTPPKRILDIGCGLARESEYFQKKYGTELYLLDGDFNTTKDKPRDNFWGSAESFKFYSPVAELKKSFHEREMSYTWVDAENPYIDENIKFDLIYSFLSCGFHYPAITYKELIKKHSNEDTIVIIDCRNDTFEQQSKDFEIVDIISKTNHYIDYKRIQIRFK